MGKKSPAGLESADIIKTNTIRRQSIGETRTIQQAPTIPNSYGSQRLNSITPLTSIRKKKKSKSNQLRELIHSAAAGKDAGQEYEPAYQFQNPAEPTFYNTQNDGQQQDLFQ